MTTDAAARGRNARTRASRCRTTPNRCRVSSLRSSSVRAKRPCTPTCHPYSAHQTQRHAAPTATKTAEATICKTLGRSMCHELTAVSISTPVNTAPVITQAIRPVLGTLLRGASTLLPECPLKRSLFATVQMMPSPAETQAHRTHALADGQRLAHRLRIDASQSHQVGLPSSIDWLMPLDAAICTAGRRRNCSSRSSTTASTALRLLFAKSIPRVAPRTAAVVSVGQLRSQSL
jgi:hypothetical protein